MHLIQTERAPELYGARLCSDTERERGACLDHGEALPDALKKYGYRVIATHLLAACWYGTHHKEMSAFAPYADLTSGYCSTLNLPDRAALGLPSGSGQD